PRPLDDEGGSAIIAHLRLRLPKLPSGPAGGLQSIRDGRAPAKPPGRAAQRRVGPARPTACRAGVTARPAPPPAGPAPPDRPDGRAGPARGRAYGRGEGGMPELGGGSAGADDGGEVGGAGGLPGSTGTVRAVGSAIRWYRFISVGSVAFRAATVW